MRTIVCFCGSTRFSEAYREANLQETLAGNIVLTIGCDMRSDSGLFVDKSDDELEAIKSKLDELHLAKFNLASEILVLNIGGYIGNSTKNEIQYARHHRKTVRWLEPQWVKATKPIGWMNFTMPIGTLALLHPQSNMAFYPKYPDVNWRSMPEEYEYITSDALSTGLVVSNSTSHWINALYSGWIKERISADD